MKKFIISIIVSLFTLCFAEGKFPSSMIQTSSFKTEKSWTSESKSRRLSCNYSFLKKFSTNEISCKVYITIDCGLSYVHGAISFDELKEFQSLFLGLQDKLSSPDEMNKLNSSKSDLICQIGEFGITISSKASTTIEKIEGSKPLSVTFSYNELPEIVEAFKSVVSMYDIYYNRFIDSLISLE